MVFASGLTHALCRILQTGEINVDEHGTTIDGLVDRVRVLDSWDQLVMDGCSAVVVVRVLLVAWFVLHAFSPAQKKFVRLLEVGL